jgi:hypothetical protein
MSDSSSERPQARVGGTYYPFSMPDDRRAPVDRDGPVIRKSIGAPTEREGGPVMRRVIGAAPVSRPAKTQAITELYSRGELTDAELGKSIVLTIALPAFVVGCLVGMLL